jgi:hypothetical protein
VGIALSGTAVCAAIQRPGHSRVEAWRATLTPLNGDGTAWPGLTEALRALARDAGVTDGRLTVALMPPLAEARGVELPPLRDAELQQLLARGASKYFVAARGAQVVGAVRAARRGGGETTPTVAAAAAARLVNAIHEAASTAGWTVETVVPAEAAWGAAASRWAGRGRGAAQLLVAHADRTDLLRVEDGKLVELRRFRAGAADAELIAEAFSNRAGHLAIVGQPDARRDLARSLSARGVAVEAPAAASADFADQPDLLAAGFATPDASPALVTDTMRAAQAALTRRIVTRIALAAGVLILASGMLEWWGVRRELDAIKAQRAVLAPQISSTLVGRTTVENAFRQLQALAQEERAAPHWSAAIAALSERLPAEAYLAGFRGRGDSVSVDGLAEHAARVFDAIEKVPALAGVHSAGPVRIETSTDGPTLEHFAIAARLVHPGESRATTKPAARPAGTAAPKGGAQ